MASGTRTTVSVPSRDAVPAEASPTGRRTLLRGLAAGSLALAPGVSRAAAGDTGSGAPPADASWSQSLGAAIVDRPYGQPSHYVKDVIRRNVPWLTATPESSVSFTPLQDQPGIITANGLFFERYHAGRTSVDPAKHKLMIHGLVERPLLLDMADLRRFPTVSEIHFVECPANGGMEWRAAQLNSLQFTHGMIGCAEWTTTSPE